MNRALIGLGGLIVALSLVNRAQGEGFSYSPLFIPQSIIGAASAGSASTVAVVSERLTKTELKALIAQIDGFEFAGYFASGSGPSREDVYAIMNAESARRPDAINKNDPFGGAWGLGQVLADIARIDYGVANPYDLLNPYKGASVSMRHMEWTYRALSNGLGRASGASEFIQAYNVGVSGYLSGRRNLGYLAKVTAARLV